MFSVDKGWITPTFHSGLKEAFHTSTKIDYNCCCISEWAGDKPRHHSHGNMEN